VNTTPGPWKAGGSEMTLATWVKGPDGKRVCSMRESEQDWGNAQLIAAAPEMLAALESCKQWMEQLRAVRGQWEAPGMEARYREVCAAITKAKGLVAIGVPA
jgi:hypothetical protein